MTITDRTTRAPIRGRVSDWMTANPCTVSPSETIGAALDQMHQFGVRHLPVLEDGKLIGIVSDRDAERGTFRGDATRPRFGKPKPVCVRELMRYTPLTVLEDDTLEEAARLLVRCRIGALPVVGLEGRLVGVISVVDLLCAAFGIPHFDQSRPN